MTPRASKTKDAEARASAAVSATPRDAAAKPVGSIPGHVPLETGLSDYGLWVAMFTDAEIPPLPADRRRGRVWA